VSHFGRPRVRTYLRTHAYPACRDRRYVSCRLSACCCCCCVQRGVAIDPSKWIGAGGRARAGRAATHAIHVWRRDVASLGGVVDIERQLFMVLRQRHKLHGSEEGWEVEVAASGVVSQSPHFGKLVPR
jgi:hypothetical protein